MRANDARRLDHRTLTELRKRAVQSVQGGQSPEVVAQEMGIHRVTIYGWLARYRHAGWSSLDARKRGGRPCKLDGAATRWIHCTVTTKNPLSLQFTFALWTTKMIGQLIFQQFGIQLSKASVCRLLAEMGVSPQHPVWLPEQQRPEEMQRWLAQEYPRIRSMARSVNAQIFFGAETCVRPDRHEGTTCAVQGNAPLISSEGARSRLNMISAVSTQGEFRFMTVKGRIGASEFIEFVNRLAHGTDRMIFLIVDSRLIHKAKRVTSFIHTDPVKERIRLFYLPLYSPESTPVGRTWNVLKNNAVGLQAGTAPMAGAIAAPSKQSYPQPVARGAALSEIKADAGSICEPQIVGVFEQSV